MGTKREGICPHRHTCRRNSYCSRAGLFSDQRTAQEGRRTYQKELYDLRVRPKKFSVRTCVLYYSPHRYVGRSSKWQRNYSGPFLVVKIHSAVTVSIQRSERADAVVVNTDKLKLFLGTPPCSWLLNEDDEPSATREMGIISVPKSPECDQGFMRLPA